MHVMSSLPHLAHKGHTSYLFQAAKTHFQFPRSLWPAWSVQQDHGCPWKIVDDDRQCRHKNESFAGSERTAHLHISVTTQLLSSLCSCSFTGLPVRYRDKGYWTATTHSDNSGWLWFKLDTYKDKITDILKWTDVRLPNNIVVFIS